ncbi:hypothetical protein RHSIM_Rhsim10G0156400 [Rhododendron simsii]|uniref:Peptidase A1 domain-containing protein n=1 Tax=Rhododendron simsii TaxID=118357 RepID=A0A834LCM2_RHOSS|nr:hypothetical protein RHSIM_Rhsim10G0156400 [Rhododendron simsii]
MSPRRLLGVLAAAFLLTECVAAAATFSSRLVHRFSDEVKALRVSRKGMASSAPWPERRSLEYYRLLASSDLERQKMRVDSKYQLLFPSEGSQTMSLGNDFGWLHYSWIDIGTPSVSFLVALDAGSDLLWVPCNCIQCAPLSASYYSSLSERRNPLPRTMLLCISFSLGMCKMPLDLVLSFARLQNSSAEEVEEPESQCSLVFGASIMQDRDLNEYDPSGSTTSKHLSCGDQLCQLGPNCQSPKQPCPYTVNYFSEDTSSSGFLVEDTLHLAGSGDTSNISVQAPVIIGCGRKQSGGYLDGVAPDGLMGLGLGEVSVLSVLAKSGLVRNSFSLCFDDDDSGRLFFGDRGPAGQHSTPFLPSGGKYITYIVGVKACCVGSSCLDKTSFQALVDSGASFTFLPKEAYEGVVEEFDRQLNASRTSYEGYPWEYCYNSSSQGMPKTPPVALQFAVNNSFVVHDPVFIVQGNQGVVGFCLAIQPTNEEIATIGQNFMTGYRMVFDRENLKLGWSRSNCQDLSDASRMPMTPPKTSPPNPLPTTEQQSAPKANATAPAVAGRTPSKSSAASPWHLPSDSRLVLFLLLQLVLLFLHPLASGL